jgi:spore coat polysaccharide biosynthesis protein SpsF
MGSTIFEVKDKVVCIIEARMASTRLPGKVLKDIGGRNSLEHIVKRIKSLGNISEICLATTTRTEDQVIIELAKSLGVKHYRGSDHDVLSRVLGAAETSSAEIIVEITGDCPFVDPSMVDQYIEIIKTNNLDYVSNNITSTYPDGFDVQVFLTEALKKSSCMATTREEREHVTMHIRQNPQIFKTLNIVAPKPYRYPEISVTLDTKEDLEVLRLIAHHFFDVDSPSHMQIIDFLLANPEISKINSGIERRGFGI